MTLADLTLSTVWKEIEVQLTRERRASEDSLANKENVVSLNGLTRNLPIEALQIYVHNLEFPVTDSA